MRDRRRDFLVEIGTEELPPKSLPELSRAFTEGIATLLAEAGLKHGAIVPYAAPRRLAVYVPRLAERQPDQTIERRGPPVTAAFDAQGEPTRAATAFAASCGTDVASLGRVTEPKGDFLHYRGVRAGAETASLLPGIVQASLDRLPIARRMRWGAGSAAFVRPVHWVVMLFGSAVVEATLLGVRSGRSTYGHRFMAPSAIDLASPGEYTAALRDREKEIMEEMEQLEEDWKIPLGSHQLQVTEDDGKTWKPIQTLWVPQPIDPKQNGWIDVFLTLPGKYIKKSPTVFRIGQPEGSSGGIGYAGHHSTGAARVWIRDTLEKPPSMGEMATSSAIAANLSLPDKGIVSYSSGRITFDGFTAPYRILGDSGKAALILRRVGRGLYVKTELTSLFPVEAMAAFIERLLDPSARRAALR